MFGLQTCLIAAALSAPADIEVVKFTSQSCVPCRTMEPILQRVQAQGYRIRRIDWEQQPDLAQRYQISAVPTLLVVSQGKIVDRIEGVIPADALLQRLAQAAGARPSSLPAATHGSDQPAAPIEDGSPSAADHQNEQTALRASVRIRVEDSQGQSYGTGTIVDVHGQEALVLTCGHLFRDSRGKGRIVVDLLAPGATGPVTGQLIRYDLDRDLALVGIRTSAPIQAVPVAGSEYHVATGQRLFTIGCNHGQQPTIMRCQLKAVNKYLGPENLVVTGRPVDGRSGGGLFSYDGKLVGVCNAADPEINEGLYAAFASVHRHLDDAKLAFVYRGTTGSDPARAIAAASSSLPPIGSPEHGPALAARGPTTAAEPDSASSELPPWATIATSAGPLAGGAQGQEPAGAEVICIIRAKNGPDAKSQVVVLERPSRDFIQQLNHEYSEQTNRQATQLRVAQRPLPPIRPATRRR
jgi:hypothetical protein